MVIGFKEKFKPLILSGVKIHTIRADTFKKWRPGMKIHFYTDVRTKKQEKFKEDVCISVQGIKIFPHQNEVRIQRGDSYYYKLRQSQVFKLAENDGFQSLTEFFSFFEPCFRGRLIHWTNLKYEEE